uniref:Uncharacterized protein LOC100377284 n=1 Tax=Saccoglossus kowalevskii TaxID=10224 RepID=A0ABM0GVJ4_SACKO|nr:PREDICTED: uncharacterized protein LOC100377284 [Saccoglossus kowalevskii]
MGITDVLLLSGVFTSALFMVSDGVSLTASLAIQTPSPPYQAGDQLVFSFQCEVTVTADQAYNVRLEFGSERLEFPSDPIENQFAWQYNKVNTPQTVEDRLTFTPTDFDEGVDSENLWLLLIVPADTAASRFVQGTFTMNVPGRQLLFTAIFRNTKALHELMLFNALAAKCITLSIKFTLKGSIDEKS